MLRYATCALVVSGLAAVGADLLVQAPPGPVSVEEPDAVTVDLAPALPSSLPKSEAPDGLDQPAAEATPPAPPAPPPQPLVEAPDPPPPMALDSAAVPEKKQEAPPPPPAAEAAPAQEAQAPAGAAVPDAAPVEAEPAAPPPRAHIIAAWQRAMVERLERAKRSVHRSSGLGGTVDLAFRIDRQGALVAKSVRRSSGNESLDRAALTLLSAAAPFPPPPAGLGEEGLSFVVPVHVDRHR